MKRLISWSTLLVVCLIAVLGLVVPRPVQASPLAQTMSPVTILAAVTSLNEADAKRVEVGGKVDVNNSSVRFFLDMPGMYPTIARKIIANAPYEQVEDIFDIPGLTDRQKEIISKYVDRLTATEKSEALTYGDDRINNGIYR